MATWEEILAERRAAQQNSVANAQKIAADARAAGVAQMEAQKAARVAQRKAKQGALLSTTATPTQAVIDARQSAQSAQDIIAQKKADALAAAEKAKADSLASVEKIKQERERSLAFNDAISKLNPDQARMARYLVARAKDPSLTTQKYVDDLNRQLAENKQQTAAWEADQSAQGVVYNPYAPQVDYGSAWDRASANAVDKLTSVGFAPVEWTAHSVQDLSNQFFGDALGMEGVNNYFQKLANADLNLQAGLTNAAGELSQGDVSQSLRTQDDAVRAAARDPAVAPILAAVATYFGQGYLAPMLSGAAAAAGAGAASGAIGGAAAGAATGAGFAASQGESNLGDAATRGAVAGGIGGAGNWGAGLTDSAIANSAIQGAGNQAIGTGLMGGNREEILQAAQTGAISGAMRPALGDISKEYGAGVAGMLGGAATGALRDGSQGAEYGAIMGGLSGLGGQLGGQVGSQIGGMLGKQYVQGEITKDRQAQMQQIIAQRKAERLAKMKADPRYKQYQMYQKIKSNPMLSRYNPQQIQQLFARFKAQRA